MIKLIFPIAGEGSRFGGIFKPFKRIGDRTFIENAFDPFVKWIDHIERVIFICTESQEKNNDVEKNLKDIIGHKKVEVFKLPKATSGPYQTVAHAANAMNLTGQSIVCDCDHGLDVDELFEQMIYGDSDIVIPTWEIQKNEFMNWSKVIEGNDGSIKMICEKEKIESSDYEVRGIIGCIGISDTQEFFDLPNSKYISEGLHSALLNQKTIKTVTPKWANFFGTPEMLDSHIDERRTKCTIFCDIDGVLLEHKPHSTCNREDNHPIGGIPKLKDWCELGNTVIITTARSEKYRSELVALLDKLGVGYSSLVMGLPAGPRVVINDHKPSNIFTSQAVGWELPRDKGIGELNLGELVNENKVRIEKEFPGGSFAQCYLVSSPERGYFVRKNIIKNEDNLVHSLKLKQQASDLERFNFMSPGITPEIFKTNETNLQFYFDMEYLDGYKNLSEVELSERQGALDILFRRMEKDVYCFKKEIDGIAWLGRFLNLKIEDKLDAYERIDEYFNQVINSDSLKINGESYLGLRRAISQIDKHLVKPSAIRPIHGDLTFENILTKENQVKLIDTDGADHFDAAELDLGKLFQSSFSNYASWKDIQKPVYSKSNSGIECVSEYFQIKPSPELDMIVKSWSDILKENKNSIMQKGAFYMCMYFIRFVPFRNKINNDNGLFALLMAVVWLNKIGRGKL